jgi:zinc ribbon protein
VGNVGIGELLLLGVMALVPMLGLVTLVLVLVVYGRRRTAQQLVACSTCGKPVSPLAPTCPACGHPR